MINTLTDRAKLLQEEVNRASQNVQTLSTQLQQATVHMHTVGGHLNEVAYLLGEAQKAAGLVPAETPLSPKPECDKGDQPNGEVNDQTEEQTAEE